MRLTDAAFEGAVERYGDTVFRLAYSYLKNRDEALDAVQTAVWLHGRAGDLCAGRMGEYAMNPTDVIAALPEVTKPIIR